MENNPFEKPPEQEPAPQKKKSRKTLVSLVVAACIGYGVGSYIEATNRTLYHTMMQTSVAKAVMQGYTFRQDAEPEFYKFNTVLYKDEATKTMAGIEIDEEGEFIGMRRRGGTIGLRPHEELFKDLKEKAKDVYNEAEKQLENIKEYFKKE